MEIKSCSYTYQAARIYYSYRANQADHPKKNPAVLLKRAEEGAGTPGYQEGGKKRGEAMDREEHAQACARPTGCVGTTTGQRMARRREGEGRKKRRRGGKGGELS